LGFAEGRGVRLSRAGRSARGGRIAASVVSIVTVPLLVRAPSGARG
jgi:hypothetical protein